MFSSEAWQGLVDEVVRSLPQIGKGLLLFLLFWFAAVMARRIVIRVGTARGVDRDLARFLGRGTRVTLIIVGAIMGLDAMGVDVTTLVAGLGLTGFALGFALKDTISNVVAGILIIIYRPFEHNDRITVKSFHGTVLTIDLRYTVLDADGKKIFVPNSILFTDAITVEKPDQSDAV